MVKRGYFGGECAQPECETDGAMGIPHCAIPVVRGDVNGQHRCPQCREDVATLTAESWDNALGVLELPVSELRGSAAKVRAGG